MMDLTVRPDVRMQATRVLHIPVKILFLPARRGMRYPLVAVHIDVTTLGAARWISQPIASLRWLERMLPSSRK
jgi:hypothetical protein